MKIYKNKDLLYWTDVQETIETLVGTALTRAMLPVACPSHPEKDVANVDAFNARVAMFNSGVRSMGQHIIALVKEMSEIEEKTDD